MRTIFLSGPITNRYMGNRPAFDRAEKRLTDKGYRVINPHEICAHLPKQSSHAAYMAVCLEHLRGCDAIYMLEDWSRSRGACIEHEAAKGQGITAWYEAIADLALI